MRALRIRGGAALYPWREGPTNVRFGLGSLRPSDEMVENNLDFSENIARQCS
jgi:hypothetical protein